ncbi:MAG: hypothetical protein HDQ89_08395 [Desulfovibrio sp.]|nr:hypothetical protein [Desulfovibrio sp.]
MKNILTYDLAGQYRPDAQVLYTVSHFGRVIVQDFVKNTQITYEVTEPGIYQVKTYAEENGETVVSTYAYRYFAPENCYFFEHPQDIQAFTQKVRAASAQSAITAFQGKIKNQLFDFVFFPARSKNLFVLCPSAITPGKSPVPHFYRWAWAAQGLFPGNVLVVSDPTFHLDPRLGKGWFFGTREEDATLYFSKVLEIFCKTLQIDDRNLCFWGSSTGGFIAMQLARYFPGSTAVAVNAQTDISRYEDNALFYQLEFPGLAAEEINRNFASRLNLVADSKNFSGNTLFMVQNLQDSHHYREHFLPFYSAVSGRPVQELPEGIHRVTDSGLTAWVYSHPDGHMAETPEMAKCILKLLGVK